MFNFYKKPCASKPAKIGPASCLSYITQASIQSVLLLNQSWIYIITLNSSQKLTSSIPLKTPQVLPLRVMSRTAASKMSATNPTPVPTPINLPYVITGIPTVPSPNGEVPIRQDCDTWSQAKANADQANLFILALRFYVDMDPLDRDSFWQTAGMFFFLDHLF